MEVPIWNKDDSVAARVGAKGEYAGDGGVSSRKCAVVTCSEATFDAHAIHKSEEGNDEVVRVRDGVYVDRRVVWGRTVSKVNDSRRPGLCGWESEGVEDSGVGPCEASWDAKNWEGGREEGSEGSGDRGRRSVEGGGVRGGESM